MNIEDIKNNLVLTKHFIERFADRFDYSKLSKDERNLSLKNKIRLLIDNRIDFYQNTDGAYSIWLNNNQEMIVIKREYGFVVMTLKDKSSNDRHDYIYKKLVQLEQIRRNKFNRTTGKCKMAKETFWNIF